LFDEPSSYLDVKQRIEAGRVIRSLAYDGKMIVVAEHDLAVLDYLSDQICMLYGEPAVYGIVSYVHGLKVGINIYLDGYLPDENVRFRDKPIKFHVKPPITTWSAQDVVLRWNEMGKSYDDFRLRVEPGEIHRGEVVGILGPNGIGKTTFIRLLAGIEKTDRSQQTAQVEIDVSYKPQYIAAEYAGSVESLLRAIVKDEFTAGWYRSEIIEPLNLKKIIDRLVNELSGGELQRTAIAACLSKRATMYLLDEPSAYLDVEERLAMARTIRRIVEDYGAAAFVVEHDVSALDFIADRIMVFSGEPGLKGYANTPLNLRDGMNSFLKEMGITFRRDPSTGRPRVNKENSRLDRHQKEIGEYYYVSSSSKEK
jgi:ATP-binding cassette subfamily E protein 1